VSAARYSNARDSAIFASLSSITAPDAASLAAPKAGRSLFVPEDTLQLAPNLQLAPSFEKSADGAVGGANADAGLAARAASARHRVDVRIVGGLVVVGEPS